MLTLLGVYLREERTEGVRVCFARSSSSGRTYRDAISGKYVGNMVDNKGRMYGRQAQMIPRLHSIDESVAAGGLSKVGSEEFEIRTSDCKRTIETRQTLTYMLAWSRLCHWFAGTYNPPSANMTISALF
jgi:hypothetical protein